MSKAIIYIISNSNFMAEFILDEFKDDKNITLIQFKEKKNALTAFLKYIRLKLGNRKGMFNKWLFDPQFLNGIQKINPKDKVLLWSIENYKNTLIIAKEINALHKESFLWNPMLRLRRNKNLANKYMPAMRKNGIRVSTFDYEDSKLLPCRLVTQVHRRIKLPQTAKKPEGIFFVGQLKGRENILSKLEAILTANNIPINFHLIQSNHHKTIMPDNLMKYIASSLMSYHDTLLNINQSECLVDIVQPGQTGLTLRPIEALFYDKKLITNNPLVKNEPFYNKNNVFILGDPSESRTLNKFITDNPYSPVKPEIEQLYHVRHWLTELFNSQDSHL